ncbi:hypothetical protein [Herbaspirillum rubrisubalbicans]|uniref:hypothetical protein n=1 Tax=Herbaspirillum rubrisubalbicans TaxID=80842 RepID=UPI0012FD9A0F|nr:hypothetical protein [Herbaspirillum rubrisubalbicans]
MSDHTLLRQKTVLYKLLDSMTPSYSACIIPVFVQTSDSPPEFRGTGSACLITYGERYFFVSAFHVFNDDRTDGLLFTIINDRSVPLNDLAAVKWNEYDLIIAELSEEWLIKNEVSKTSFLPVEVDENWVATPVFTLAGYPATQKNLLQLQKERTISNRTLVSFTAYPHPEKVEVKNAKLTIAFTHDPKTMTNSDGLRIGGCPPPPGMSGGAALQLAMNHSEPPKVNMGLLFAGILCSWIREKKAIAAIPADVVIGFIEKQFFSNSAPEIAVGSTHR